MSELSCDVAIIGGGPGGYATALRASQLNLRAIVIEQDKIGGTCLHRGCIPATSLLQCASILETARGAEKFGIRLGDIAYDWPAVQKAKQIAIKRLFMGLSTLFKQRKVQIVTGTAGISEPGIVNVDGGGDVTGVRAQNIVIATGSNPPGIPGDDNNAIRAHRSGNVLDTTGALDIDKIPDLIAIIGAGSYGIEFASLFRSFGSEVSIIEKKSRLAPRDDTDVSKHLEKAFKKRGIITRTDTAFSGFTDSNGKIDIGIENNEQKQTISADKILMTTGRTANVANVDTVSLDITVKDGFIKTDPDMKTGTEGIYAVGDVTHNPQYANFAFQEGIYVAETIGGLKPPPLNLKQIPIYTFAYPELAKVGYSEDEARVEGLDIDVADLPFQAVSRSAIDKEETGYIKIVALKNGAIIGVHMVGVGVINLIAEAMLITNWEATAQDVAGFLHPHPTFAESIGETVLKLAGKPLHSL